MMTISDIELLRSEELRRAIDENIERDATAIALDKRVPHASLVATEVKYLQRARRKLPRLYDARCIIPPRAFEQSSGEEAASRKALAGKRLLDLTCGLGIDVIAQAAHFESVVALERDPVLAEVVRYNLQLLGIENVEVITTSAEEYVASCNDHFDWVFADPDRRSADGKKMVCMEDCSPNILALMPRLKEVASRVALKLSPLFDCDEAFRLFGPAEVEVVSIGGECKELNVYTNAERNMLHIAASGFEALHFAPEEMSAVPSNESFEGGAWRYLIIPDVALQKGRVAVAALRPYGSIWSNNGYGFSLEPPAKELPCRTYEITAIEPYRPKELKRSLKGKGVEILKRDTQLSVEGIRRASSLRAGNDHTIAVTTINRENWVIHIK